MKNYHQSLFEKSIIYNELYKELLSYLTFEDCSNIIILNKNIYNDIIKYTKAYLDNKSSYVINIFKKFHLLNNFISNEYDKISYEYYKLNRIFIDGNIHRKYQALLYYTFYERKYRISLYNEQTGWKKEIVDTYKTIITDNPSKYDLFLLIKSMPVNDSSSIGW
jgi:hypothetical protein